MRRREPRQHEWGSPVMKADEHGNLRVTKRCMREDCPWQMLSRKNRNRYRNGPNGEWKHSPKDCKGEMREASQIDG